MGFNKLHFVLVGILGSATQPSCRKSMDMSNAPSTSSPANGVTATNVPIPVGFTAAAFEPGRYASVVDRQLHGTHSLQVLSEDSTAMLVLELLPDGTATAMRGWRYITRNDGPQTHSQEHYREQQGYRGTFTTRNGTTEVALNADDTVCPGIFEGELALQRATELVLRCVRAVPPADLNVGITPLLLCHVVNANPSEMKPQIVASIASAQPEQTRERSAQGDWFALGSGNGLAVHITGRPWAARAGSPVREVVSVARLPIVLGTWQQRLAP